MKWMEAAWRDLGVPMSRNERASQSGYTVSATVTSMGARGALVAASWSP